MPIASPRADLNWDNDDYVLAQNDGQNHLHGGIRGFDKAAWRIEAQSDSSVTLKHVSADGDEGYPGELTVQVKYVLNDNNELRIEYEARSDRDTPVNLTNHSYFNLKGEGRGHDCRSLHPSVRLEIPPSRRRAHSNRC